MPLFEVSAKINDYRTIVGNFPGSTALSVIFIELSNHLNDGDKIEECELRIKRLQSEDK